MKVSLNWVKKFTDVDLPIEDLVSKIGAQLGAVEEVINLGERYQGILVVKVAECAKHPDADKLSICLIDDGGEAENVERNSDGLVQVVCGAPNVAAGQLVAWIPPGATVPSTFDKDPFVLEAKELRGVISNGMIASAKELAIGDDHDGIVVLDEKVKPGDDFAKAYELDDYIIDIENKMFTHRPDLFGMLGIAREIAGIQGKAFTSPDWYRENAQPPEGSGLELTLKNEAPKLVPRFCALAIKNVEVGPSPIALQTKLSRLGIRPINNIVDITNWLMIETGQPLHAYDYDKLKTGVLGVRLSKDGEELALLNGKMLKLKAGAVVITDGDKPVGLGGIMGGADTEVDGSTKSIILECATFDMNLTRKTAMTYGLFTDAVTRFTKGQSLLQNSAVMAKTVEKIHQFAGGEAASSLIDEKAEQPERQPVVVMADFINTRLGENLPAHEMKELLTNVEFDVSTTNDELLVKAPFWRTDIEIPEDIVEEVGRLHGYDKLPKDLPKRSIKAAPLDAQLAFKSQLRDILVRAGANELLTYSFVNERLLRASGQDPVYSFHIKNALSPDLQYYRLSLVPSLLDKVHPNIKQGFDDFCLFEIGKVYRKAELDADKLPAEVGRVGAVIAGRKSGSAAYYDAKHLAEFLFNQLGLASSYQPLEDLELGDHELALQMIAPFEPRRSAAVLLNGKLAGLIGEFKHSVNAAFKLPARSAGFELFLSALQRSGATLTYEPLNRFPETSQDLCLKTDAALNYQELTNFLNDQLAVVAEAAGYGYKLEPLDIYQRPEDTAHKQTTWRITLWHREKTLTTEEVNRLLDTVAAAASSSFKAERV